jgi:hypothetical protein
MQAGEIHFPMIGADGERIGAQPDSRTAPPGHPIAQKARGDKKPRPAPTVTTACVLRLRPCFEMGHVYLK